MKTVALGHNGDTSFVNVAVIGAGLMGHALAAVHAIGGLATKLYDSDPTRLANARSLIGQIMDTLVLAQSLTQDDASKAIDRISYCNSLENTLEGVDLIVEAVTEKPEVKKQVYKDISRFASPACVIASNTSYLDIFPFIPAERQRFSIIAHWYTPPYIVDLVDVVPGPQTDPAIVQRVAALYKSMGKHPIIFKKFIAGYIANRLQTALNLEVFRLLEEQQVSAADIDDSIRHGLALRLCLLGQLQKADFTGLEMVRNGLASKAYEPPVATGKSPVLDGLIAQGKTGIFSGEGFYDYKDTPAETLLKRRDLDLLTLKHSLHSLKGFGT